MKGQYFSIDAVIAAIVFMSLVVISVSVFFSSSFLDRVNEEYLRIYALKISNLITSHYSEASFYPYGEEVVVDNVFINSLGRRINEISPYRISLYLDSFGCSFKYFGGGKGKEVVVYRILSLNVECGGQVYYSVPSLLRIEVREK